MRQVNIRILRSGLSTQLMGLPFQITRNGKIIGIVCTQYDYLDTQLDKSRYKLPRDGKAQVIDNLKQKIKCTQPKATIATGGSFFNPRPKKNE